MSPRRDTSTKPWDLIEVHISITSDQRVPRLLWIRVKVLLLAPVTLLMSGYDTPSRRNIEVLEVDSGCVIPR